MSLLIRYTTACDCGGTMIAREMDLTQEPGEVVTIDLDWLGDITLECNQCSDSAFLPSISDYIEDVDK